ncbi:MAG TPA: molybdopterin-dependent oxidoreductase [Acidimicrobiia bacterium]|jgi:DMSO/TMAO reductase YedYZ molybdopterin-dependent catalytic subunit|nr:molybdopterin-dependent oxidoreductase [Acidimicrobiia bacterium]
MSTAHVLVTGEVASDRRVTAADMDRMTSKVDDVTTQAPGATGRAVRIADVIATARPNEEATHCTVVSAGGDYRASIPLPDLLAGGWLAFAIGEGPLPIAAGGSFRLTVAQGSTLCWNVKQVATLKLTSGPEPDDVPENPPH